MTDLEKKQLMWGGGIVLFIGVVYLATKKTTDDGNGTTDPTGNDGTGGTGNNTIPFNANSVADNLYQLMDGYGTKEDEIIAELQHVSLANFPKVVLAFGKKPYYLFGGNDWFGTPQNLKYWLQEELGVTSSYYRTLKLKYPQYL